MMNDARQVVHPRAAGLEVHKVETTARVYRDPSTDDEALIVNRTPPGGYASLASLASSNPVATEAFASTGTL